MVYLHLGDFYGRLVGKYTVRPMHPMGYDVKAFVPPTLVNGWFGGPSGGLDFLDSREWTHHRGPNHQNTISWFASFF